MKLLLHACCGPCSLEPMRLLKDAGHDITIFYANSNIDDTSEYARRLKTLLEWANKENIAVVEGTYSPLAWQQAIGKAWKPGTERSFRCATCYQFRFDEAAKYAHEHGFEAIATTLSVSPYQFTQEIEQTLLRATEPYPELIALFEDYRPYYPDATRRSKELGMYRQNYCGCHWSKQEAQLQREAQKAARKEKKAQEKAAKLAALKTEDFDYELPDALIAQEPCEQRDECRMLVMKRDTGALQDRVFRDIYEYLKPGDLLVANETRVIPARLLGNKRDTHGAAEVLLLRQRFDEKPASNNEALWEALVKPGRRLKPGALIDFIVESDPLLTAEVVDWIPEGDKGQRLIRLTTPLDSIDEAIHTIGHTPLPPYIHNYGGDEELYQTVFSREERSAAAPTAGLHFTQELLERLKEKGIGFETVHLEVGIDTFRIVEEERPRDHKMHSEFYTVSQATIDAINETKARGNRVIAVGTTSVRSLESAWDHEKGGLRARNREATQLFILPGYDFKVVDALITNFHVPRSTLMMLVSAFSSPENIQRAYRHAVKRKYRFLSFGDAMFMY